MHTNLTESWGWRFVYQNMSYNRTELYIFIDILVVLIDKNGYKGNVTTALYIHELQWCSLINICTEMSVFGNVENKARSVIANCYVFFLVLTNS